MLAGGMQRGSSAPVTPKPSATPPIASSASAVKQAKFNCADDVPIDNRRQYRCCELPTQNDVLAAYENGAVYLDHDFDGWACEAFARTRVWDETAIYCSDSIISDVRYHLTTNNDYRFGGPYSTQPRYLPNGRYNPNYQAPSQTDLTATQTFLIIRGKPYINPLTQEGAYPRNPSKNRLGEHLWTAMLKAAPYSSGPCQNANGVLTLTARAVPDSQRWDAEIAKDQPSSYK
jgi:hypothetical protein